MTEQPVTMFGYRLDVTDALGRNATDGEHMRRIVRWGMADVLAWLGEELGPPPWGIAEVAVDPKGRVLWASQATGDRLRRILDGMLAEPRVGQSTGDSRFVLDIYKLIDWCEATGIPEVLWVTPEMRTLWS